MKCPGEFISQETRWVYNMQRKPYILRYLEVVSEKWCNKNRAGSGGFQGLTTDPIEKNYSCDVQNHWVFVSHINWARQFGPISHLKNLKGPRGTPWMVIPQMLILTVVICDQPGCHLQLEKWNPITLPKSNGSPLQMVIPKMVVPPNHPS